MDVVCLEVFLHHHLYAFGASVTYKGQTHKNFLLFPVVVVGVKIAPIGVQDGVN